MTDFAADFIRENRARPFALVVAYKEAHSQQTAPPRFDSLFENDTITLPATFNEDKSTKPAFFRATMNIPNSGFAEGAQANQPPAGMTREQLAIKKIKNYYRCIAALDDYVGRIRKALADSGQLDKTILVFAGDNGYFLGERPLAADAPGDAAEVILPPHPGGHGRHKRGRSAMVGACRTAREGQICVGSG